MPSIATSGVLAANFTDTVRVGGRKLAERVKAVTMTQVA